MVLVDVTALGFFSEEIVGVDVALPVWGFNSTLFVTTVGFCVGFMTMFDWSMGFTLEVAAGSEPVEVEELEMAFDELIVRVLDLEETSVVGGFASEVITGLADLEEEVGKVAFDEVEVEEVALGEVEGVEGEDVEVEDVEVEEVVVEVDGEEAAYIVVVGLASADFAGDVVAGSEVEAEEGEGVEGKADEVEVGLLVGEVVGVDGGDFFKGFESGTIGSTLWGGGIGEICSALEDFAVFGGDLVAFFACKE